MSAGAAEFVHVFLLGEQDAEKLHPDDRSKASACNYQGTFFTVEDKGDVYWTVACRNIFLRVHVSALRLAEPPAYWLGDQVRFKKGGAIEMGEVESVGWHFKRDEALFTLSLNGKRLKKAYYVADLTSAD